MQQKLERKAPRLARFLKEIEIQFKWLFIWVFFRIVPGSTRRHAAPLDSARVKAILFLRQDRIGDMVVTLPTLHTLKQLRPDIRVGVLASPANEPVIEYDPHVDAIHIYRKRLGGMVRTFRQVQAANYDLVIDLMSGTSVTSLVLSILCAPRAYRIGIVKEAFRKYYDYYTLDEMNRSKKLHITEAFRTTLLPLGIKLTDRTSDGRIALSPQHRQRGQWLEQEIRDPRYRGLIMLNASAGKLDRTISDKKFICLVEYLSKRYPDLQFMISYAPKEIGLARRAIQTVGENVTLLPEGVSVMELAALMTHLDAVISVDTAVCHIAANLDVPLLAMYNGNDFNFARWYPYGPRVWVVRSPDWKNVDGITFEQLQTAVDNFISDLSAQSVLQRTA